MDASLPPNKRRKTSPADQTPILGDGEEAFGAEFSAQASRWNLEQAYEKRPRKQNEEKKKRRLPIKTARGAIEEMQGPLADDNQSSSSADDLEDDTPLTDPSDAEPEVPSQSSREQIISAKEELAKHASLVNEDPEEHYGALKKLAQITSTKNATVVRLGLATQLAVYKDIIPGYRIRALTEEETKAKVSKEVRRQRAFEQAIVKGYQAYVGELKRIARLDAGRLDSDASLVDVAVGCACNLSQHVSHFNFRNELLAIVVDKAVRRSPNQASLKCVEALARMFENDDTGNASLEAVGLLSKMIKSRHYRVHESVLNLFLRLRLLCEFSQTGSDIRVDRNANDAAPPSQKAKKQWQHRSKQERKLAKERKAIEKEMQQADAVVSHEERDKNQAETLKLVFSTYFRILKERIPGLMGAVLEGLVNYAHLVNQDFFGDLLEALRELIQDMDSLPDEEDNETSPDELEGLLDDNRDSARERLLCVITAFGLLQGQEASKSASSLGLDLSFFVKQLYRNLHDLAMSVDIEKTSKSPPISDPDSSLAAASQSSSVNVSTTIVLLLRSLRAALVPQNTRNVPPIRLAAFSKQLRTLSLQIPEKSCTAMLGLLNEVLKTHRGKINALWNTEERRGDGTFNALHGDIEGSNPFATTIWEGELLQKHFSPQVREGERSLRELLSKA